MNIRLIKPFAVFFPNRVEPEGSCHSIGAPRGRQLVAEGIAVEYHGQPGPSEPAPDYHQQPPASPPLPTQPDKAKIRSALVCAGQRKDPAYSYARPRNSRSAAARKAEASASLRRALARKKATPGDKTPAAALRAAIARSSRPM